MDQITKSALAMKDTLTFSLSVSQRVFYAGSQSPLHARIQHLGSVQYRQTFFFKRTLLEEFESREVPCICTPFPPSCMFLICGYSKCV